MGPDQLGSEPESSATSSCASLIFFWRCCTFFFNWKFWSSAVFLRHVSELFIFSFNQAKAGWSWKRIMSSCSCPAAHVWTCGMNNQDENVTTRPQWRRPFLSYTRGCSRNDYCGSRFRDPDQAFHGWHSGLLINPHASKWWRSWRKLSGLISGSDTIRLASKHLLINSIIHRLWPPRLLLR